MLTIKDAKEFRGLATKDRIATARKIGEQFSEGTALGKIAMMALGAGMDAKASGDKTFTFDATFNAFAETYYDKASEGTIKAYRSAFGNWTKAGMLAKWDASEIAVRVFNERQYPLTARSGMLNKLLKLDAAPTAKQYAAAKPKKRNNDADATFEEAAAALNRKVGDFAVAWSSEMNKSQTLAFAAIVKAANDFVALAPVVPKETKGTSKKKTTVKAPTPAELRAAQTAKLLAMVGEGVKTIQ
jgi:hypothetical protein